MRVFRVRTLNPSGDSPITYPPWSVTAPYSDSSLVVTNVTATGATLTISTYHTGDWWYKADANGPHTTCQGPVSTRTETLTGLTAGTTYKYRAYDATGCAVSSLVATAAAFTTTIPAPTNLTLRVVGSFKVGSWDKPAGVTGSVNYEIQHANNATDPYGNSVSLNNQSGTTMNFYFDDALTYKFRGRAKVGSATSAWAEYLPP